MAIIERENVTSRRRPNVEVQVGNDKKTRTWAVSYSIYVHFSRTKKEWHLMFKTDWKVGSVDLSLEFILCSLQCKESFSETKCNNFWQSNKTSPMHSLNTWRAAWNDTCIWTQSVGEKERHWHVLIANWMWRKCITTNYFLLMAGTELHHRLTPNLAMGHVIQLCRIMRTKNILILFCCSGF